MRADQIDASDIATHLIGNETIINLTLIHTVNIATLANLSIIILPILIKIISAIATRTVTRRMGTKPTRHFCPMAKRSKRDPDRSESEWRCKLVNRKICINLAII